MTDVTVISCVYGDTHWQFVNQWWTAIYRLNPAPTSIIVATDNNISRRATLEATCTWKYPQAFYLQQAIDETDTDWVWICDIDDIAYPDALAGLDEVAADVWQMGYDTNQGESHIPPRLTNDEYVASWKNPYVAGSAIRMAALREVGGFNDVCFQDWDLWLRLAEIGAIFEPSGRTHFQYTRWPLTRTTLENTPERRLKFIAEMDHAFS